MDPEDDDDRECGDVGSVLPGSCGAFFLANATGEIGFAVLVGQRHVWLAGGG